MNTLIGIVVGVAIGIATSQFGSAVAGPSIQLAATIVASVILIAAIGGGTAYIFRGAILTKLRLKIDARVEDISGPAKALIEALNQQNIAAASTASVELIAVLVAWQSQLRARQAIVATLSGLLALLAAVFGSALLVKQNELIDNQNNLLYAQTRSNQLETAATVLSRLGAADFRETGLLIGTLSAYGEQAFLPLLAIAKQDDVELSNKAMWAIVLGGKSHGKYEMAETMALLGTRMIAIGASLSSDTINQLGVHLQQFNNYSHQLPKELLSDASSHYANIILDIHKSVSHPEEELAQDRQLYLSAIHFDAAKRIWCQNIRPPTQRDMISPWKPSDWKSFCAPDAKPLARNPYLPAPPSEKIIFTDDDD